MIKTILTGFVLGLILILFIPVTLILASWNAVPGDSIYSVKVGLEKAILGITPSDNLKTTLEIRYTERRFSEVEKIISSNTNKQDENLNESLTNLTNQAIASKNSLQKSQNIEEKTVQKEALIATLESISVKIEEKKQISNTNPNPTKVPTKIPTKTPTNTPEVVKPNVTSQPIIINKSSPTLTPIPTLIPTAVPTQSEDIQPIISPPDLDDTQEIIDEIIDELKGETSTQSTSDNKNNDKPTSRRDKNDSSENNNDNKNKNKDSKDRNDRRP